MAILMEIVVPPLFYVVLDIEIKAQFNDIVLVVCLQQSMRVLSYRYNSSQVWVWGSVFGARRFSYFGSCFLSIVCRCVVYKHWWMSSRTTLFGISAYTHGTQSLIRSGLKEAHIRTSILSGTRTVATTSLQHDTTLYSGKTVFNIRWEPWALHSSTYNARCR